jgi:hypothetical protein
MLNSFYRTVISGYREQDEMGKMILFLGAVKTLVWMTLLTLLLATALMILVIVAVV